MAFDLTKYEPVKKRKKRFYEANKDGRIVVRADKITENEALFFVQIFKNKEDQHLGLPWATGYAQEFKGVGSMANKASWCENCEESAIGRALDNAGYSSFEGPSYEEMQKVERSERSHVPETHPGAYSAPTAVPPIEVDPPEDYQIPFGADIGKRLSSFTKAELEDRFIKVRAYIAKTPNAAPMYVETMRAIELVLGGPITV